MGSGLSLNIKYLLWKDGIPKHSWVRTVGGWLNDAQVAHGLLQDREVRLSRRQLETLASELATDAHSLVYEDLIANAGIDLVRTNVAYLVDEAGHGSKARLAEAIGCNPTTVSRWFATGGQETSIPRTKWARIASHFGLGDPDMLASPGLFLSLYPASSTSKRKALLDGLSKLPEQLLIELYPALAKLILSEPPVAP